MSAREATFPLVPRFRLLGLPFGGVHSARRGLGSDAAGSRPYRRGDDVASIDWAASARLSAARDTDEFLVRERFAEEAPRVVVVADRRPAMSAFPPELPWLEKPRALRTVAEAVARSAFAARGLFGYVDFARGEEPFWRPPQSQTEIQRLDEGYLAEGSFRAPRDNLVRAFELLSQSRRTLPAGTFVFVVSDFVEPPPAEVWLDALESRWDVVPVVVQDPVWEQSFPDIGGVGLPVVDPATERTTLVRVSGRRARERMRANEERLRRIVDGSVALGLEPVLVSAAGEEEILASFLRWADERRTLAREWRLGA